MLEAKTFRDTAETLFPSFIWHPWAERMLNVCCQVATEPHPHVALNGCAMSSKTDFMALYGLTNWAVARAETVVFACDVNGSRSLLWNRIRNYFEHIRQRRGFRWNPDLGIVSDDGYGRIQPLATKHHNIHEWTGRLVGCKARNVILLADDLTEIPERLLDVAFMNLVANPRFQMIGAGNFASRKDAFGRFAEPLNGWDSVDEHSDAWATRYGWCLRFDGLKSPNLTDCDKWPIYGTRQLECHRRDLGENSPMFWRLVRSFEKREQKKNLHNRR